LCSLDEARAILFAGNIRCYPRRFRPGPSDLLGYFAKFRLGTRSDQHRRALGGKPSRDSASDPAPASRNHSDFVLEKHPTSLDVKRSSIASLAAISKRPNDPAKCSSGAEPKSCAKLAP